MKVDVSPPDLSGLVQKPKNRPCFEGTYSRVFFGEYKGRKVAIKEIRTVRSKRVTNRKFQRELQTWWKLRHPNILPLLGYIDEDSSIDAYSALISPWVEGGTAAEYIRLELTASQRLALFNDVIKGLQYLHTFKPIVVHGDLKPLNVLVTSEGVGQICDFGLIRLLQEDVDTGMTTTTAYTGTTRYLAYELVKQMGTAVPTTATDVYALGCLGLEFICGISPHQSLGNNLHAILQHIGNDRQPAELPKDGDKLSSLLWDLIEWCWEIGPEKRPTINQIYTEFELARQKVLGT
ncbi:kinase-like protein [Serendipita vermifera]|nr:kinase-like protein [Serendipita vermifera]